MRYNLFNKDADLKVIVNQLGFRNGHARKRVIIPDVPDAEGVFGDRLFTVFEQNNFSKYALDDPRQFPHSYRASLNRQRGDFGKWLVGDFSHIDENGIYQVHCGNVLSPSFAIRDDLYCRVLPECLRYFEVQSCGRKVPGWHDVCHLDDGYVHEEGRYLEAKGGWHDAGDFRKWASSTALIPISLLLAHRMWGGREAELGLEEGVFLNEALHGVRYFLNLQDSETGALFQNVGGGYESSHDNLDCRYTDNIPESGDERKIWTGWATPASKFTTLYALYANALKERDPELARECLHAAKESMRYDLSKKHMDADHLQWRAWAYLEIWRFEGDEAARKAGVESLERLLDLQVCEYVGGQTQTRGFFRSRPGEDDFHRKHVGACYPVWVCAEFIDEFPDDPRAGRWRDAIALWAEEYAMVFAGKNVFGLLPHAVYQHPPSENEGYRYRQIGERLFYRYFVTGKFGTNARSSLQAVALGAAARVLDRPELAARGYRLLEWTLGNNPFQLSTMNGVGVIQPCALSFQMGNIPGGVTMGIFGDENDQPWYPDPFSCYDEYYGYQTSQFLWAALVLQTCAL